MSAKNGPDAKKRKRSHKSGSSSGQIHQLRHNNRAVINGSGTNAGTGVNGGAAGCSSGAFGNSAGAYGSGGVPHNNGSNSHRNGSSRSNGSNPGSSRQITVLPRDVMATAQAEMRQAGYELLDQLGHGGFSLVYSGKPLNNTTGDLNQVKTNKRRLPSNSPNAVILIHGPLFPKCHCTDTLEAAALLALESVTSVVDLLGYGKMSLGNDDVFCLVMEKPTGCISFASYLRRQTPLSATMAFFLKQLVSMVAAIHRCGWVHGDLKHSNLLICAQDQLKAIDCSLAMEVVNDKCIVPAAGGTLLWNKPPERLNGVCDLVKSTVWSVGVIYYQWRHQTFQSGGTVGAPAFDGGRT
ncbi:serine threonine-protein kinase pim-3 [Apostichopus japonicus]|uniref:Serine threonine-protein kinase pim-3 n=1 Tax=Stichopus japonicus TaxID=307972 RepID=A0A2G8LRZ8_STIJA|nr:serine threonine-protein kinase pim-3 [Apostichopus japonicus]